MLNLPQDIIIIILREVGSEYRCLASHVCKDWERITIQLCHTHIIDIRNRGDYHAFARYTLTESECSAYLCTIIARSGCARLINLLRMRAHDLYRTHMQSEQYIRGIDRVIAFELRQPRAYDLMFNLMRTALYVTVLDVLEMVSAISGSEIEYIIRELESRCTPHEYKINAVLIRTIFYRLYVRNHTDHIRRFVNICCALTNTKIINTISYIICQQHDIDTLKYLYDRAPEYVHVYVKLLYNVFRNEGNIAEAHEMEHIFDGIVF